MKSRSGQRGRSGTQSRRGGSASRRSGGSRRSTSRGRSKPLRGVGSKEERQYEHIKESAQKSGRYGSRAKEVAARTVMKMHKNKGHQKGQ